MSEMDDLRGRPAALEAEVDRLREESAATRTMAATANRDSAEVRTSLRGHTQVLNAIREDQIEQRQAMTRLAEAVGVLVAGQAEHGRMPEEQGRALETLVTGQTAVREELRRLGEKREVGTGGGGRFVEGLSHRAHLRTVLPARVGRVVRLGECEIGCEEA
ncbi:hypothetical protein ACIPLC_37460 [Kitasatospora sp. NPDC086801]|uniref:hypothetical protein n=1 Tax=Kitasatospora sp. NPDC086801 TaxID=3364066 RepID=UPI00382FC19B